MKSISKITSIGIPAFVGLGVAWLGIRFIQSERILETRRMELELQLNAKAINIF